MQEHPFFPFPENDDTFFSGAGTEMTGLIPSGHPEKEERDNYQDIFPWLPPFANVQI